MGVIDKIVGAAGQVAAPISSAVNAISTSIQNRKNREWTEKQNDLAWQRQNQLINEQRAYDTPKAQMQRLMEAGLNPNLIYGDLGGNMQAASAPNAAGSYSGVAPQIDPLAISQSMLNFAQARRADVQSSNESKLTEAKVKEIFGETPVSKANIQNLLATASSAEAVASKTYAEIGLVASQIDLMSEQKRSLLIENTFNERTFNLRVRRFAAQTDIDDINARNLQRVLDATIREMLASASASFSQASLNKSVVKLNEKELSVKDALVSYYNACSSNQDANTAYVNLQKELDKAYGGKIRASQILNNVKYQIGAFGVNFNYSPQGSLEDLQFNSELNSNYKNL